MAPHLDYRSSFAFCVEVKRRAAESWRQPTHLWKMYVPLSGAAPETITTCTWLFACWNLMTADKKFARRTRTWPNAMSLGATELRYAMVSYQQIHGRDAIHIERGWFTLGEWLAAPDLCRFYRDLAEAQTLLTEALKLGTPDAVRLVFWKV